MIGDWNNEGIQGKEAHLLNQIPATALRSMRSDHIHCTLIQLRPGSESYAQKPVAKLIAEFHRERERERGKVREGTRWTRKKRLETHDGSSGRHSLHGVSNKVARDHERGTTAKMMDGRRHALAFSRGWRGTKPSRGTRPGESSVAPSDGRDIKHTHTHTDTQTRVT